MPATPTAGETTARLGTSLRVHGLALETCRWLSVDATEVEEDRGGQGWKKSEGEGHHW